MPPAIAGNNSNYASLQASDSYSPQFTEGIAAKIVPVVAGKEYIFSFFLCSRGTQGTQGASLTFEAELTNCQVFPINHFSFTIAGPSQTIFCESKQFGNEPWRQYVVKFTATGNYDMIVLHPSVNPATNHGWSYVHIAYPELIEVEPLNITSTVNTCGYTLTASPVCTVKNAVYTWTDQNGTVVGTGQQINVGTNAATYSCTVSVPTAEQNPNNSCSNNNPVQTVSVTVAAISSVITGTVTYTKPNFSAYPSGSWETEILGPCSTSLCFLGGREVFLDLLSPFPTGNFWEVTISNPSWQFPIPPVTNPTGQNCTAYVTLPATFNGHIKIKLTNNGNVYTYYINTHHVVWSPLQCNSIDPAYNYKMVLGSWVDPANSYFWAFPQGMIVDNVSTAEPKFSLGTYSGAYPVNATLQVINSACNASYTIPVPITNEPVYCSNRPANENNIPIVELTETKNISIYPNPTSGIINFKTTEQIKTAEIFSIEGKLLRQFFKVSNKIDITTLSPGSYIINVVRDDGKKETAIVVKQ